MSEPLEKDTKEIPMSLAMEMSEVKGWDHDAKTSLTQLPDESAFSGGSGIHSAVQYAPNLDQPGGKIPDFGGASPQGMTEKEGGKKSRGRELRALAILSLLLGVLGLTYFEEDILMLFNPTAGSSISILNPENKVAVGTAANQQAVGKNKAEVGGVKGKDSKHGNAGNQEKEGGGDSDPSYVIQSFPNDPYTDLPNNLREIVPLRRIWTAQEEEKWREGIAHDFIWQRYKTVQEVRGSRLTQSKVILWDALNDDIFWVRIRAVLALADFGLPITISNVGKAIGDANDNLVAHFFMRFIRKASPSDLFVLRIAINVVGPASRLEILKVFQRHDEDEDCSLYLYAATKDPDQRVKNFGKSVVRHWSSEKLQAAEAATSHVPNG